MPLKSIEFTPIPLPISQSARARLLQSSNRNFNHDLKYLSEFGAFDCLGEYEIPDKTTLIENLFPHYMGDYAKVFIILGHMAIIQNDRKMAVLTNMAAPYLYVGLDRDDHTVPYAINIVQSIETLVANNQPLIKRLAELLVIHKIQIKAGEVHYYFSDDKQDKLLAAHFVLSTNPHLIPKGVFVHFQHYINSGNMHTEPVPLYYKKGCHAGLNCPSIEGTADSDIDYSALYDRVAVFFAHYEYQSAYQSFEAAYKEENPGYARFNELDTKMFVSFLSSQGMTLFPTTKDNILEIYISKLAPQIQLDIDTHEPYTHKLAIKCAKTEIAKTIGSLLGVSKWGSVRHYKDQPNNIYIERLWPLPADIHSDAVFAIDFKKSSHAMQFMTMLTSSVASLDGITPRGATVLFAANSMLAQLKAQHIRSWQIALSPEMMATIQQLATPTHEMLAPPTAVSRTARHTHRFLGREQLKSADLASDNKNSPFCSTFACL